MVVYHRSTKHLFDLLSDVVCHHCSHLFIVDTAQGSSYHLFIFYKCLKLGYEVPRCSQDGFGFVSFRHFCRRRNAFFRTLMPGSHSRRIRLDKFKTKWSSETRTKLCKKWENVLIFTFSVKRKGQLRARCRQSRRPWIVSIKGKRSKRK